MPAATSSPPPWSAPARRAGRRARRTSSRTFVPPGLTPGPVRAGLRRRGRRRSPSRATPGSSTAGGRRADGRPVRVDAAAGPARSSAFEVTIGDQPVTMAGRGTRSSASSSARSTTRTTSRPARCSSGCATGCSSPGDAARHAPVDGPLGRRRGYGLAQVGGQPHRRPGGGVDLGRRHGAAARPGRRRPDAPGPTRCSAAPPTCCSRPGTSPTGCGWSTATAAGARVVLRRDGNRAMPVDGARAHRPAGPQLPGLARRHPAGGRRRTAGRRTASWSAGSATTTSGGSSGPPGPRSICRGRRGRPADPRHRLALADQRRRAAPAHRGRSPRSPRSRSTVRSAPDRAASTTLDRRPAPLVGLARRPTRPLYSRHRRRPRRPHRRRAAAPPPLPPGVTVASRYVG